MSPNQSKPILRRTKSSASFTDQQEKQRKYRFITADKPFHQNADSLFSASSGFNNYRGLLNLSILLLVLSNMRVALENIIKYGILINPVGWCAIFLQNPGQYPTLYSLISVLLYIGLAYCTELLLSHGTISNRVGRVFILVIIGAEIIIPALVILWLHPNPAFSSFTLLTHTIVVFKLWSYHQVNSWCRAALFSKPHRRKRRLKSVSFKNKETMDDHFLNNGATTDSSSNNSLNTEIVEVYQSYPQNLHLRDLAYFICAPTLCYELNFPRSARIRKRFLMKRVVEMIFLCAVILSLIQQWIIPTVISSLEPFTAMKFSEMIEKILKLAVPNHVVWLLFFYWYFHSVLNVSAELLQFGDRVFYRDWWNAETVQYFWQNWNIPVHRWASRHLYKPLLQSGFGKLPAGIFVFFLSAFFHEYLLSIPLRMFRLYAFMGMIVQIPLAVLVNNYLHGWMGNIAVWLSLILGQPVAILMYYHDYFVSM